MIESLPAEVLRRLDQAATLRGPRTVEPLPGGLTNLNFRITTAAGQFVARLSGASAELLSIDRDAEHLNSVAAAQTGIAPPVAEYVPEAGLLVIGWIEGRTLTAEDLDDEHTLSRLAASCRKLHSGPRFVSEFDMFALQRQYLDIVQRNGFRLPSGYLDLTDAASRVQAALLTQTQPRTRAQAQAQATVPCNNDLLPANMIDDGTAIRLIDFEYSGNNDPCFELGNIWSEATLAPERLSELVTAYFGRESRSKIARARLLGLMSKYGWTLWASIQQATSPLDFDFWSWGMEKYDRALAEFHGPELPGWLDDVQLTD